MSKMWEVDPETRSKVRARFSLAVGGVGGQGQRRGERDTGPLQIDIKTVEDHLLTGCVYSFSKYRRRMTTIDA